MQGYGPGRRARLLDKGRAVWAMQINYATVGINIAYEFHREGLMDNLRSILES